MTCRVPVAVGAKTGSSSGTKTGARGFCVAQPDGGNADSSTLNHMHWVAEGGSAQMQVFQAEFVSSWCCVRKILDLGLGYGGNADGSTFNHMR